MAAPAGVELAWLAKFKLNVWAAAPFNPFNPPPGTGCVTDASPNIPVRYRGLLLLATWVPPVCGTYVARALWTTGRFRELLEAVTPRRSSGCVG